MADVQRACIWCGNTYQAKRSSAKVCSTKCSNEMNYVRARDWDWLTPDEFTQTLMNWIASGSHMNPKHPLVAVDNALADVYRSLNNLLKVAGEIK